MNKRDLAIVVSGVVAAIVIGWWLHSFSSKAVPQAPIAAQATAGSPTSTPDNVAQATQTGRQIAGGAYEPSDPRWKEVHAKDLADKAWEWKMPINFFGRVLDENEQPVRQATIVGQWS